MPELVLAIDEGTTGVRALLFDRGSAVRAEAYRRVPTRFPAPGLVEHDAEPLWQATTAVARAALAAAPPGAVAALGLATQRATAVVWEAASGQAVAPIISWQDSRGAGLCRKLFEEQGLFLSPFAAASKVAWILERLPDGRRRAERGELRAGTLDSWLLARLSRQNLHVTDPSAASCSGFYDLLGRGWNAALCEALHVPLECLPRIVPTSGVVGETVPEATGLAVPIAALAGDQQAAMFGQLGLEPGTLKATYGTAAIVNLNAGSGPLFSSHNAYPLVAWDLGTGPVYCLEGTAITAGAAVQWLCDALGVAAAPEETAALAGSVPDTAGVWAVPAFQGLGTPHFDPAARAVIGGLSRGSTRAHVVRAVLEGVAWRCREVIEALLADSPHPRPRVLRVDGGAARNDFLLQAQADALGWPVERPATVQAAALGVAYLAGLAVGLWQNTRELEGAWRRERLFEPRMEAAEREERFGAWRSRLAAARSQP